MDKWRRYHFILNIRMDDENSRLATALISVQKEIPFYFGQFVNEVFTVEKQLVTICLKRSRNDMQNTFVGVV